MQAGARNYKGTVYELENEEWTATHSNIKFISYLKAVS